VDRLGWVLSDPRLAFRSDVRWMIWSVRTIGRLTSHAGESRAWIRDLRKCR